MCKTRLKFHNHVLIDNIINYGTAVSLRSLRCSVSLDYHGMDGTKQHHWKHNQFGHLLTREQRNELTSFVAEHDEARGSQTKAPPLPRGGAGTNDNNKVRRRKEVNIGDTIH